MWRIGVLLIILAIPFSVWGVQNGQFIARWDIPVDQSVAYEFRWQHFAHPEWMPLPSLPAKDGTFTIQFDLLPQVPTTDRWMCLDARIASPTGSFKWLSETATGASCASIDVGIIVISPPPPIVVPPPPIVIPPPVEIFTNLKNSHGVISFDYLTKDCKRIVTKTTSQAKDGRRTITLTCK